MNILIAILFIFLFVLAPLYLRKINDKLPAIEALSDVVICFGFGILLGNTKYWWMPSEAFLHTAFKVAETSTAVAVLLAIPMLLITSDIRDCMRYASKFMLSFVLGCLAVIATAFLVVYWFPELPNVGAAAGCLVGTYIGGTPNMVAVSYALNTPDELLIMLNSTDIFCGGIYFFFLTSIGKSFFSLFLPAFASKKEKSAISENIDIIDENTNNAALDLFIDTTKFPPTPLNAQTLKPLSLGLFWAVVSIGISVFFAWLIPNPKGEFNEMVLMIVLSTVSIGLSFNPKIQTLKGVYEFAEYLLLIFAVGVGFMADFSKLLHAADSYLAFNAVMILVLLLLHLILARIFKIDVDTFIITSAACVYGPPFMGQICSATKNKEMLAPGMALAVLGLIIGTYCGILVAGVVGE